MGTYYVYRYVLFATHFKRMGELASIYPNVKVCYFSVEVQNERLKYEVSTACSHRSVSQKVFASEQNLL